MPPSRSTGENKTSLIVVMVVFIVLFLVATVFAVVFYMNTEQLKNDRMTAEEQSDTLATTSQYNEVKGLAIKQGGRVQTTVVGRLNQQYNDIVDLVLGDEARDVTIPEAWTFLDTELADLWDEAAMVVIDSDQVNSDMGLKPLAEMLINEVIAWRDRAVEIQTSYDVESENFKAQMAQTEADMAALEAKLAEASAAGQQQVEKYTKLYEDQASNYEEIITGLNQQVSQAKAAEKDMRDRLDQLQRDYDKLTQEIRILNERIRQFQPSPETEAAALKPDGYVVSANVRDGLAYINLKKSDSIYRGLTFTVYDSFQMIPKSGQGKGMLEVIEIMDNISKCRIVEQDLTNPIMKNDIIANLIWDEDKSYLFCVVGDFDIDGDGQTDIKGREHIATLIENWGGRITDHMNVETDFLVVGEAPETPERPNDEYLDGNSATAQSYREAMAAVENYQDARREGAALGVPTFNLARFYAFIGVSTK